MLLLIMEMEIIDSGAKKVTQDKIDTYEHACRCFLGMWGIISGIKLTVYVDYPKKGFSDKKSLFYKQYHLKKSFGATFSEEDNFHVFIDRTYIKKKTKSDEEFVAYLMNALAHEMVHVKQIHFSELEYIGDRVYFHGEDITEMHYDEQPHEDEAYEFAEKMRREYNNENYEIYDFLLNDYTKKNI